MKKAIFGMAGVILLVCTSCSIDSLWNSFEGKTTPVEGASIDLEKSTKTVSIGRNTISVFGQVSATAVEDIMIEFPASVEKVSVRQGQKVKSGDSLITLNLKEFESQMKSFELDLGMEQADIFRIKNTYLTSNSNPDIQKLLNDLANAEDQYNKSLKELSDKQKLLEAGAIAKYDFDEFQKSVDEKKNEIETIKFSIDSLKSNKQVEMDPKSVHLAKLENELGLMKDKLNRSYIRGNEIISNIRNGAVFDIGYTAGDIIDREKKALSILDLDSLIVKAELDEKSIKNVKVGADAILTLRSDNSKQYKGKLSRISSVPVSKDGEAYTPVEISIENKDDCLLPNYYVNVKIASDQKK